ncbi:MAG: hypothetical protein U9O94_11715 [Nanoarchaeota archaeon]|nr:hypothetical protein [Nanoarchaeota archaeon]
MRKGSGTKERISITLDEKLVSEINRKCEKRLMKVSNYIERLIEVGLKYEK